MSRRFFIAIPAAVLLASFATPALADPDASKAPARVDFSTCSKPMYPSAAKRIDGQGTVVIAYLVGTDGRATESKIVSSSGHASLDETAREAIGKCNFYPAMQDGKVVSAWTRVQYVWTLK